MLDSPTAIINPPESHAGLHTLAPGEILRLEQPPANTRLEVVTGILWITQTGDGGDHLLQRRESFAPHGPGTVLAEAVGGPAVLRIIHRRWSQLRNACLQGSNFWSDLT